MEADTHSGQVPLSASMGTWTGIPTWAAKGIVWAIPFLLAIVASLLGVLVYMYVTDRAQNAAEHLELRQSIQGVRNEVQDVRDEVQEVRNEVQEVRNEVQDVRNEVQVVKDEVRDVKVAVARVEERLQFLIQQARDSGSGSD